MNQEQKKDVSLQAFKVVTQIEYLDPLYATLLPSTTLVSVSRDMAKPDTFVKLVDEEFFATTNKPQMQICIKKYTTMIL